MTGWGTWEELLLGGAVQRHGTRNWETVASELRARAQTRQHQSSFTPEVCRAKYEDLRKRYSGRKRLFVKSSSWFEELRKKRIVELKKALEQSEDTIGILELKLHTLKTNAGEDDGRLTDSPNSFQKTEGIGSSCRESSKDGLSADAARPEVSQEEEKPVEPFQQEKSLSIEKLAGPICNGQMESFRKWKGKRKRRIRTRDMKGSQSLGGLDVTSASLSGECSTRSCFQVAKARSKQGADNLMRIFNSVVNHEKASVFRHGLDSEQKRSRFKEIVRCPVDVDTIRSKIIDSSITFPDQLFRDLLLLANNSLVSSSRRSSEFKTALLLRDSVTRLAKMRRNCRHSAENPAPAPSPDATAAAPPRNNPAKPRSARRYHHKSPAKPCGASGGAPVARDPVRRGGRPQGKSGRGAASGNRLRPATKRRKRGR